MYIRAYEICDDVIQYVVSCIIFNGCTSIEVAKELTKLSKSTATSIKNITKPKEEEIKEVPSIIIETEQENTEQQISIEKKEIIQEKIRTRKVVKKQQKIAQLNLLGKTLNDLNKIFGKPQLHRKDQSTIIIRYDSNSCRIFLFMNCATNKKSFC